MARHALVRPRGRRPLLVAAALCAVLLLGAAAWFAAKGDATDRAGTGGATPDARGSDAAPTGRLAGWPLFVERTGPAVDHLRGLEAAGRTGEAAAIRRIAEQPTATWFADEASGYADRARRLVREAGAAGQVPVLSVYYLPQRDCSGHSAGGARDAAAYRRWVGALAAALAGHRAIVVLEPDAVAHAIDGCLPAAAAAERYRLLGAAVDAFRTVPGVRVYLDAGNPTWVDAGRMAPALRAAGIDRAHGFALNVANFESTPDNIAYGTALSGLLGGAHFVVDTSRNGNGPAQMGAGDRHWCNPPGRALGTPPTVETGHPLVDAYLWIKRPGESDGACTAGSPPAGRWFPRYALELAGHPG
ncbi:glucanase [Actinoplanes lobatus]|uniref:Glucanase n=1 Tax=Actinoplanes lobatus TaxID=113568 RepID=A0A7W7HKR5_9ACTN|nr:glycoside hydrolase family 6 protein [Actinoplanes lobatus]MBB4752339.1 endoglucanase [Actinoplanes lobatus]GGN94731.1 glucanase [Actinoplanes lobatus]GIE45613.1 glucanase [Actinoplanes lobatus]